MIKTIMLLLLCLCAFCSAQTVPSIPSGVAPTASVGMGADGMWKYFSLDSSGSVNTGSGSATPVGPGNGYVAPVAPVALGTDGAWHYLHVTNDGELIVTSAGESVPCGSNTQVQYNSSGSCGAASGFLTNGTHQAMGASSAIDGDTELIPIIGNVTAMLTLQEANTTAAGVNGIINRVDLSPTSDPSNYTPTGFITYINYDTDSLTGPLGGPINVNGATFWMNYNEDNNGSFVTNSDVIYVGANHNGDGTVSELAGIEVFGGNYGNGTISTGLNGIAIGSEVDGGSVALLRGLWIEAPDVTGGTVNTSVGLQIDEQTVEGADTSFQINSTGTALSYFAGPIETDGLFTVGPPSVGQVIFHSDASFPGFYLTNGVGGTIVQMLTNTGNGDLYFDFGAVHTGDLHFRNQPNSGTDVLTITNAGIMTVIKEVLTAAAPSVSSGQIGLGSTTAAASNCNQSGTLSSVAGCLIINVAGTTRYVPYF